MVIGAAASCTKLSGGRIRQEIGIRHMFLSEHRVSRGGHRDVRGTEIALREFATRKSMETAAPRRERDGP